MSEQTVVEASDDDLGLREYLRIVLRHWRLVVALGVAAGLAGLGAGFLSPPSYEAQAMVANTSNQAPAGKALLVLATGDEALGAVLSSQAVSEIQAIESLSDLRSIVSAQATSDTNTIALKVRAAQPEDAAAIANAWAEAVVEVATQIYGQSESDLAVLEAQLAQADASLRTAEAALEKFAGRGQLNLLSNELSTLDDSQRYYLQRNEAISRLIGNINFFTDRLREYPPDSIATVGNDVAALLLEVATFSGQQRSPVQLNLSPESGATTRTVGELVAELSEVNVRFEAEASAIDTRLDELAPQMLSLEEQVQRLQHEADRLDLTRNTARDTYQSILRKLDEARIATQGIAVSVKVASQALPPAAPASSRGLLYAVLAAATGLMLGIGGAIALDWWRQKPRGQAIDGSEHQAQAGIGGA